MIAKFHISKDGVPRQCKAGIFCPLGEEAAHFETRDEAQAFADKKNAEKFGLIITIEPEETKPEETKPEPKKLTKDQEWKITSIYHENEPKFETDEEKYKYRRENSDWRQTRVLRDRAIQSSKTYSQDLYEGSTMGVYLEQLKKYPDGPIYEEENASWNKMITSYTSWVDSDFEANGGAPDYFSYENLKKLHIEGQKFAFDNGIGVRSWRDDDIIEYYADKNFELAPQTKEEYDEMNRLHDELEKAERELESSEIAYKEARENAAKINSQHKGLSKIKNIKKIFDSYNYAFRLKDNLNKNKAKAEQLKEDKDNWHKVRKTDPLTSLYSRLNSYILETEDLEEVSKGVKVLRERFGIDKVEHPVTLDDYFSN